MVQKPFTAPCNNHRIEAIIQILITLLLFSPVTAFLSSGRPTTVLPTRVSSNILNRSRDCIARLAARSRNSKNGNDETVDSGIERRKLFLGLLFPLTVAVGANAPFLYVMANPPSAEERDAMLMDFCNG